MMNNLKDLIKVTFIDNFNLNKWFNLKNLNLVRLCQEVY